MENLTNQIHKALIKSRKTIAAAESCTGGLLSELLTETSGSSAYFILGVVTYSNKAKGSILGIPQGVLSHGAVSPLVARLMARGIRKIARADIGVAITGIAGPTGARPGKPVGTVFIAVDTGNKKTCQGFCFKGSRRLVRKQAALKALALVKSLL